MLRVHAYTAIQIILSSCNLYILQKSKESLLVSPNSKTLKSKEVSRGDGPRSKLLSMRNRKVSPLHIPTTHALNKQKSRVSPSIYPILRKKRESPSPIPRINKAAMLKNRAGLCDCLNCRAYAFLDHLVRSKVSHILILRHKGFMVRHLEVPGMMNNLDWLWLMQN